MPRSFLIKKANTTTTNYSHCPLKKRPVHIIKDTEPEHDEAEPENLSTKPEDLSLASRRSVSPPSVVQVSATIAAVPPPPAYYCKPGVLEPLSLNTPAPEQICWPPPPQPRQFYPPTYAPLYPRRPPLYPPPALSPYAPPRAASASPPARLYPAYAPPFPEDLQAPALPQPRDATELLSPASSSSSSTEVLGVEDLSRGTTKRGGNGARYQCPACSKSYSSFSGLSKHRTHHCPASAGSESAAADQANNNAVAKSFSCKYCEKTYVSLGALKMHIRTHTLPCKCKLCGKAFSRPWLLQGHIRTHTGEKPFACQHCRRAFADRSNLRAHLQTHSDVKKYSCQHCSKTFSRMSLLGKHMDGGCPGLSHPGISMSPTSPPAHEMMQHHHHQHPVPMMH
ncbi:hypothetical protein B566_EDAN005208 [Ephemera danica]|nr:hypothetical protein B566_EDAN005208 [Ephemera danica]